MDNKIILSTKSNKGQIWQIIFATMSIFSSSDAKEDYYPDITYYKSNTKKIAAEQAPALTLGSRAEQALAVTQKLEKRFNFNDVPGIKNIPTSRREQAPVPISEPTQAQQEAQAQSKARAKAQAPKQARASKQARAKARASKQARAKARAPKVKQKHEIERSQIKLENMGRIIKKKRRENRSNNSRKRREKR